VAGWALSQDGLGKILAGRGGALRRMMFMVLLGLAMSVISSLWASFSSSNVGGGSAKSLRSSREDCPTDSSSRS